MERTKRDRMTIKKTENKSGCFEKYPSFDPQLETIKCFEKWSNVFMSAFVKKLLLLRGF